VRPRKILFNTRALRYHFRMPSHICLRRLFVVPTFVVLAALLISSNARSAKGSPQPNMDDTPEDATSRPSTDPILNQTIDIGKPPPAPSLENRAEREFFYQYRSSITARVGLALINSAVTNGGAQTIAGAEYAFTTPAMKIYEGGADIIGDGTGNLHFSRKIVYSRSEFRPYIKVGAGLLVNPSDGLVTFIKYQNYQIRAAMGLEELLRIPRSMRLELEGTLGGNTTQASITAGYVFAW
jgi:hypothetical protein